MLYYRNIKDIFISLYLLQHLAQKEMIKNENTKTLKQNQLYLLIFQKLIKHIKHVMLT